MQTNLDRGQVATDGERAWRNKAGKFPGIAKLQLSRPQDVMSAMGQKRNFKTTHYHPSAGVERKRDLLYTNRNRERHMYGWLSRLFLWLLCMHAPLWPVASYAASCDVPAGYYRVVGSSTGNAVQLRSKPSSSADLMGTLENDEIVFSDGSRKQGNSLTWQRIQQNQVEGWVEASHLWRALPMTLAKTDLPAAGYCGASSPPWGLRWDDQSVRMSLFPEKHEFIVQSVQSGVSPGSVLVSGSAPEAAMSFVYSDEICRGAGNSTVSWGSAYIVLRQNGVEKLYKGCCNALRIAFTNR